MLSQHYPKISAYLKLQIAIHRHYWTVLTCAKVINIQCVDNYDDATKHQATSSQRNTTGNHFMWRSPLAFPAACLKTSSSPKLWCSRCKHQRFPRRSTLSFQYEQSHQMENQNTLSLHNMFQFYQHTGCVLYAVYHGNHFLSSLLVKRSVFEMVKFQLPFPMHFSITTEYCSNSKGFLSGSSGFNSLNISLDPF